MHAVTASPGAPVETVIVLPNLAVNLRQGPVMSPGRGTLDGTLRWIWRHWQAVVEQDGGPVVVRVGLPDGRLDARLVAPGVLPVPVAPTPVHDWIADPTWHAPIPDRDGLLATALAGQRAGQWAGAGVAAGWLAVQLHRDLGIHPSTVLAMEIQAQCAALAGHRDQAAVLYLVAAVARHHLGAPLSSEAVGIQQAVSLWLHAPRRQATARTGLLLAHHLLDVCPTGPEPLSAVLRRLDDQLPTARKRFTPPPSSSSASPHQGDLR